MWINSYAVNLEGIDPKLLYSVFFEIVSYHIPERINHLIKSNEQKIQ